MISESLQKLAYEGIDKVLYNKGVYSKIAENYKNLKENGVEPSEDMKKYTAIGGYIHDNGFEGSRDNYKPYYEYLNKNNYKTPYDEFSIYIKEKMLDIVSNSSLMNDENIKTNLYNMSAKNYIESKNNNYNINDNTLKRVAEGGYIHDHGFNGVEEGYKEYYDYLKDNNYETPYNFEYEPYLLDNNNYSITFDHEVDTSNTIQIIEEMYNEEPVEEEVDSNDVINIMNILTNKVKEVKKTIIHYISNYRPIMNQYTGDIDIISIE